MVNAVQAVNKSAKKRKVGKATQKDAVPEVPVFLK